MYRKPLLYEIWISPLWWLLPTNLEVYLKRKAPLWNTIDHQFLQKWRTSDQFIYFDKMHLLVTFMLILKLFRVIVHSSVNDENEFDYNYYSE